MNWWTWDLKFDNIGSNEPNEISISLRESVGFRISSNVPNTMHLNPLPVFHMWIQQHHKSIISIFGDPKGPTPFLNLLNETSDDIRLCTATCGRSPAARGQPVERGEVNLCIPQENFRNILLGIFSGIFLEYCFGIFLGTLIWKGLWLFFRNDL